MEIRKEMIYPSDEIIDWLLASDVSIKYQTHRDLLDEERPDLQARIMKQGWGKQFLKARNQDGTWGLGFYQPKWISSHYSLLDLKNLNPVPDQPLIAASISCIAENEKAPDGGINPHTGTTASDVCVNGMFLNYACYFSVSETDLHSVIDFLINQHMQDGGFNCRSNRSGCHHSSLHSTISVIEGLQEYFNNGYKYRVSELQKIAQKSREFILLHSFYKSDHTGKIIHPDFLKLPYPHRWKYNVLRALDHFATAGVRFDERMSDAIDALICKRHPDGKWPLNAAHPGQVHFQMEQSRQPSRWNTLSALRVLKAFGRGV